MQNESTLHFSRLVLNPRNHAVRRILGEPRRLYGHLLSAFDQTHLPNHTGGGEEQNGRASGGLLYRIEPERDRRTRGIVVLVQSSAPPQWGDETVDTHGSFYLAEAKVSALPEINLQEGMLLRFRLRACPVRSQAIPSSTGASRRNGKRISGKRQPVYTPVLQEFEPLLKNCDDEGEFRRLTALKNTKIEASIAEWVVRKLEGAAMIPRVHADNWPMRDDETDAVPPLDLRIIREQPIRMREPSSYGGKRHRGDLDPVLYEGHFHVREPDELIQLVRQGIGPGKAMGMGMLSLART